MVAASLDLDIAALVGEMEALECEHSQHGDGESPAHADGPATHYVMGHHPCTGSTPAYAACSRMVAFITADRPTDCGHCGERTTTGEMYTILGPVTTA